MKKIYFLAFLLVLSFSACNIFENLDSKKKSSSVLEFQLNEKMNSGDYQGALIMARKLIEGNSNLRLIDNKDDTHKYIKENYTDRTVQTYIKYKALEAEAYLGLSNVKMSDILAKIADENKSNSNYISKSSAGDDKIKIKDIIPDNINEGQLLNTVEAYLKALARTQEAYDYLKDIKSLGGKTLNADYLSGGLALAIRPMHKALVILGFYDEPNTDEESFKAPNWDKFKTQKIGEKTRLEVWNENAEDLKAQLGASIVILEFYDADFDLDKVLEDAKEILDTIKKFDDSDDYDSFIKVIGLDKEGGA